MTIFRRRHFLPQQTKTTIISMDFVLSINNLSKRRVILPKRRVMRVKRRVILTKRALIFCQTIYDIVFSFCSRNDWIIMATKLSEVLSSASGGGKFFAALLLCFCMLQPHESFSTPDSLRCQKVGLVLSGGGARGVAHLGVLRALEEAQIPVD